MGLFLCTNRLLLPNRGKSATVLGQPYRQAVPELEGQGFFDILEQVWASGQAYETQQGPAQVRVGGVMNTYYFDYFFKPLRQGNGAVYAILNMAIEVSPQVLARQAL